MIVARAVAGAVAGLGAAVVAWALLLGVFVLAAWAAVAAGLALALARAPNRRDAAAAGAWVVIGAVLVPLVVWEAAGRLDALAAKKERDGPEAFDRRDLAAIWGLNLGMAAGGFAVGFPEVACETLLLATPGPEVRDFHGDFAMRSPRVRRAVAAMAADVRAGRAPARRRVDWPSYAEPDESLRVALALNAPLYLDGAVTDDGRLAVLGSAEIAYPRRARLRFGRLLGRELVLDEGLFWVLQERGWFDVYVARWHWTVALDDPGLEDTRPRHTWFERVVFGGEG